MVFSCCPCTPGPESRVVSLFAIITIINPTCFRCWANVGSRTKNATVEAVLAKSVRDSKSGTIEMVAPGAPTMQPAIFNSINAPTTFAADLVSAMISFWHMSGYFAITRNRKKNARGNFAEACGRLPGRQ